MRAYYVTNNAYDTIVVEGTGVTVPVDAETLAAFLAPEPDFANWVGEYGSGEAEDYGDFMALRVDAGPVQAADPVAFSERVRRILRARTVPDEIEIEIVRAW